MIRKKFYFGDVFSDPLIVHTLKHATFKGPEIGECLAAAFIGWIGHLSDAFNSPAVTAFTRQGASR